MKKILSIAVIFLIVLSTFSMFAPKVKAESDYQLTTDPLPQAEPSWSPDGTKIVYLYYTGGWYKYIYVMNNDGTDQTQLTGPNVLDHWPAYSPDGTKIAFQRWGFRGDYWDLMIMDADGSNVQRITYSSIPGMKVGSYEYPRWSEDGTKLVFQYKEATTAGTGPHWVCTMNIDGSDVEVLPQIGMFPRFCRGDTKIVFNTDYNYYPDGSCIALMDADGTGMQILTDGPNDGLPHMSSTSNRIIFGHGWEGGGDLYVMNEDGSGLETITSDGMFNGEGEWSPDEEYIVYTSRRSGNCDIWKMEVPSELLSLPAGATNSANGRDTETILLSIDVDSKTSGDQQVVTVSPGETITITATFQVWSSGGPGIIKQAFFIYSWTPSWPPPAAYYEPLYNGQPGYHPGVTLTRSFSVTVPEDVGNYYLWFCLGAEYSMANAVAKYDESLTLPAHAKIVVGWEAVLFEDDFESYAVGSFPSAGGWQLLWSGAGSQYQVVVDAVSVSPTKSLQMLGSHGWSAGVKRQFTTESQVIGYEVYVRTEDLGGSNLGVAELCFFNEYTVAWGRRIARIVFWDDGIIRTHEKATGDMRDLGPYSPNTWYKVRVILDKTSNLYDVWINDVLVAENVQTAYSDEIESFKFENGWAGVKSYFDDVKVFVPLAPPPVDYSELINKYFPHLIFDEEEEYFPTNFYYLDQNIDNNPSDYDKNTWPLTVYVHTVEGRWLDRAHFSFLPPEEKDYLVIQYWFYYAKDSKLWDIPILGAHDHDWESVFVFLEKKEPEPEPEYVVYFHHSGGVWWIGDKQDSYDLVPWENPLCPICDVDKVADTHPVVHVARHSHASYPWTMWVPLVGPVSKPLQRVLVPVPVPEFPGWEVIELPYAEPCDGGRELDYTDFEIVIVDEPDPEWPTMFGEIPAPWAPERRRWNDPGYLLRVVVELSMSIIADSPVNLLVTAPDGLRTGYDLEIGSVVNEIVYAKYSGPGSEPQVISIPDPLPGVYTITAFGIDSGPYTLTFETHDFEGSLIDSQTYTGKIVQDAVYVYNINITDKVMTANPDPVAELEYLKEFVMDLPVDVFVTDDPDEFAEFKKEMFDKIDETLEELYENKYLEAIEKLGDMKEEVTDEDELQPATQSDLCVIIDHIISSIETLQQA